MALRGTWLFVFLSGCGLAGSGVDGADGSVAPSTDAGGVDYVQFCTDRDTYACARDLSAGRTDMATYNSCSAHIDSDCMGQHWPAGCAPTQALADACIRALSSSTRLSTPTPNLTECSDATLCGS